MEIERLVDEFSASVVQHLQRQLNEFAPEKWRRLALYGAGLVDADPDEMRALAEKLAQQLFAVPGTDRYEVPVAWAGTPMGALWWRAVIRSQGDELITLAEAARLAGVSVQAISQRIERGKLQAFVDPLAPARQGRKLVRRSDVE